MRLERRGLCKKWRAEGVKLGKYEEIDEKSRQSRQRRPREDKVERERENVESGSLINGRCS